MIEAKTDDIQISFGQTTDDRLNVLETNDIFIYIWYVINGICSFCSGPFRLSVIWQGSSMDSSGLSSDDDMI